MNVEAKKKAIHYFLNEVLNAQYPLDVRKQEMLRVGKKTCQGFPEWSDLYGSELKPIDDITYKELISLIETI